ncbi:MAG: hypothetical protein AAF213_10425, partial [Pseudomonadota bacterium]
ANLIRNKYWQETFYRMVKLRKGLLDPRDVAQEDIPAWLATTYGGYLTEIQNRLWEVHPQHFSDREHSQQFYREVLALQLRICLELIAHSIGDLDQLHHGTFSPTKRSKNNIPKTLKGRQSSSLWPRIVHPQAPYTEAPWQDGHIALIKPRHLQSVLEIKNLKGRIDDLIHGLPRPRKNEEGRLSLEDLLSSYNEIKAFADRQLITDEKTFCWYIDSRNEFRKPTGKDAEIIISIRPSEDFSENI